jgi:hypothetical protein
LPDRGSWYRRAGERSATPGDPVSTSPPRSGSSASSKPASRPHAEAWLTALVASTTGLHFCDDSACRTAPLRGRCLCGWGCGAAGCDDRAGDGVARRLARASLVEADAILTRARGGPVGPQHGTARAPSRRGQGCHRECRRVGHARARYLTAGSARHDQQELPRVYLPRR